MKVTPITDEYYNPEVREGFRIAEMTKRYWAVQLKVLCAIDSVCEKHGLRWFAEFGTLIGAVRHRGFIPWDDDTDIAMFRKDYERFLEVAPAELPATYRVFDVTNEPGYDDPLGRVVNNGRIQFDPAYLNEYCGCPYTAGVDIFLLDGIYDDPDLEQVRCDRAMELRRAYDMVAGGGRDLPECRALLGRIRSRYDVALPVNDELGHRLAGMIWRNYAECDAESSTYVSYMKGWTAYKAYKREKSWYDRTVYLPFENLEIPVPAEYDAVLRAEYGDYMRIDRGGGVAHPYPVYRMQQEILLDHLSSHPDDRLSAYIHSTADKHMEHDAKCTEILNMCDQVTEMIRTKVAGDQASCHALLQGMISLLDSLTNLVKEDYSTDSVAVHRIEKVRELIDKAGAQGASDPAGVDVPDPVAAIETELSALRADITELYRGHGPIEMGDPS